jgi:hypothetical protein
MAEGSSTSNPMALAASSAPLLRKDSATEHLLSTALSPQVDTNIVVQVQKKVKRSRIDRFNIDLPWSPHLYYYSVRGAENFHIYLWILKDWGWTQDMEVFTLVFGYAALAWCGVLLWQAISRHNWEDTYHLFPLILWLFGNFWWMYGEVVYGDDDTQAVQGGDMFLAAMALILLYHMILRPCGLLVADADTTAKYEAAGLHSRFSYFENWRQYEHIQ